MKPEDLFEKVADCYRRFLSKDEFPMLSEGPVSYNTREMRHSGGLAEGIDAESVEAPLLVNIVLSFGGGCQVRWEYVSQVYSIDGTRKMYFGPRFDGFTFVSSTEDNPALSDARVPNNLSRALTRAEKDPLRYLRKVGKQDKSADEPRFWIRLT